MTDERDEIRSRINIVDLVGEVVHLKKAGKTWKGLCPFHADKNPSFYVDQTFGSYRCWSCSESGDIFTWVMKTRHVDFPEALRILAERAGVELGSAPKGPSKSEKLSWAEAMKDALSFFCEQLSKNENALAYCERRGLHAETRSYWELGYAPDVGDALAAFLRRKGHSLSACRDLFLVEEDQVGGYYDKFRGRLIFPIRDEAGSVVAFGGRLLGDGHPKYINSSDTPLYRKSKVLYGMHRAKDVMSKTKRAVLVEGYVDVIACHASGVTEAVASLGTALAEDHAKLLRRWCENVTILYDSDSAGQKAAARAVEILQAEKLRTRIALMPEGEDPDTLLKSAGPAAVKLAVDKGIKPTEFRFQKLQQALTPSDDEFWPQAVEILADERNELLLDKFIVNMAALYPGATDQISTQNALRNQVKSLRRRRKQIAPDAPAPKALHPFRSLQKLHSAEIAMFKAVLDKSLRVLAWSLILEPESFLTTDGRAVAGALKNAFGEHPPEGAPASWVNQLQPDDAREIFMVAQYDPRVEIISQKFIEDAVRHIRAKREKKSIRGLLDDKKSDESLNEITERLRKLKGQNDSPQSS